MGHHTQLAGTDLAWLPPVVLIGLGIANCFFGYRFFRVLLGLWGFVAGAALAVGLLARTGIDPIPQLAIAIVAGVVGAVLVSVLYLVGVFVFGAGFGALVASAILQSWPALPAWPLVIVFVLLGGFAALGLQRPLIMVFTAFGGAWGLVSAVAALSSGCSLETLPSRCPISAFGAPVALGAWLLVSLLGLATQARHSRRSHDRADAD